MINERKALWYKSCKESRNREEYLWTQTEQLRGQNKETEITRNDMVGGLRRSKKMRDEEARHLTKMTEAEEILSDQKKMLEILTDQEDENWPMFDGYMDSWEPTKRKINLIAKQAWQLNQSTEPKSPNLEHGWDVLMALVKECDRFPLSN